MQLIRRSTQFIAMAILGVSYSAQADSWNCSNDDLVREVQIEYPEGGSVPCNVIYKKQTEGFEDQVLWSAENQEGYCEEKAREFVANLESWGWVCLETVSASADTEQAEAVKQAEEVEQAEEAAEEAETVEAMEQAVESEQDLDTE
jgi:hypothetical protein